jgi:nicotinamidase-related amidase
MTGLKPDWIAPARTALVLIDMQVDFALPDGALGRQGFDMTAPRAAVEKAQSLTEAARRAGVAVVFVRLILRPEDDTPARREYRARRGQGDALLCAEGTRGAEFVGPQPQSGDYVVSKTRYSGFTGTRLEESLRAMGRNTLVIAGLTSECCVAATAWDAFERDFQIVIAADAVAAYQPQLHQAALQALNLNCALLFSTQEIASAWSKPS